MIQHPATLCRRRAFTLIELLVVVAIIALLISILLPALTGARKQSKQVYCLANMNSIGKAALIYAQDNRDTVVQGDDRQGAGTATTHFAGSILPALGYPEHAAELFQQNGYGATFAELLHKACRDVKLLQCPTFPEDRQSLDYVVNAFPVPTNLRRFGIGTVVGPRPVSAPRGADASLYFRYGRDGGRTDLSRTVYVTEAHERMPLPSTDEEPWDADSGYGLLTDLFIPNHMPFGAGPRVANDQRHPRGITAVMFDGHGEVLPLNLVDSGPPHSLFDRVRRFVYDEREPQP